MTSARASVGGIIPLAKRLFGTNDISAILSRMDAQPGYSRLPGTSKASITEA